MALDKELTIHGVTGRYWQICNRNFCKDRMVTAINIRCYVSAEVRAESAGNFIDMPGFLLIREFDGDLSTAECYTQLKVSQIVDGVETNFFVDAEDLL